VQDGSAQGFAIGGKERLAMTQKGILKVIINLIKGRTSPLWINSSKVFYKVFFVICLVVAVIFIASFIAIQYYNSELQNSGGNTSAANQTCVKNAFDYIKSFFIIIGSAILFLNCKTSYKYYSLLLFVYGIR
jgi:hypothetical protein